MGQVQSTADHARAIRAALKRQGWNARQISVKTKYYSGGSSITVTIKDQAIPLQPVEQVANAHESITRCEITGEILSGGNRYVHVSYDSAAVQVRAARYRPAVEAAVQAIEGSSLVPIAGTPYLVGRDEHGRLTLWSDTYLMMDQTANGIAQAIAHRLHE